MQRTILTVSGFDPSGGAGVHADVKTARALGFHSASVITALTVQNTCGAKGVYPVDAGVIGEQVKVLLEDFEICGVKIGLIPSVEVAEGVKTALSKIDAVKVLDPVIAAGAGGRLGDAEGYKLLMKSVDVVTPNLSEAVVLSGLERRNDNLDLAVEVARAIREEYDVSVIVTGGELKGKDVVVEDETYFVEAEFSPIHIHGTGCVYSTALTCYLADGRDLENAVRLARLFVLESVKKAVRVSRCYPIANP